MPSDRHDSQNVAIVYHYFASYRLPILKLLNNQPPPAPRYTLISGVKTDRQIKTIDPALSNPSASEGGLRWRLVNNFWFLRVFLWQSGVVKISLTREFDTIIYLGQMYFLSTWVSALFARLTGKRVLFWSHGFIREENNLQGAIRSLFYRLGNGMLLYGKRAKEIMISKGFAPSKLHIVFNSLDYDAQTRLRESMTVTAIEKAKAGLFPEPSWPVLVFVGRLTREKQLQMLLEAAKELHLADRKVNVLLVGDGPEKLTLEQLASDLKLEGFVHFYGACHDEATLAPLIMLSTLCVSPGEVGLTAIHAMTYGTPIVTHDNPAKQGPEFEAIIEGRTGTFFKYGSVSDLAQKIALWLDKKDNRGTVRTDCYKIVDEQYNPHVQLNIINAAVCGEPSEVTANL